MKHKTQSKSFRHIYALSILPILGIAIVAGVASSFPGTSRAADSFKNAPVGFADYCRLEGSSTVIYGWAHDSQAGANNNPWVNLTIGGRTARVATSIDNYRENWIHNYLQNNNYKTASKYGFKASFSGVYKGSSPAISGRIENVDAGSNQNLQINTNTSISSGPPDKYYFAGNRVPDACLPAAPVVSNPGNTPSSPTTSTPTTATPTTSTPVNNPPRTSSTSPSSPTPAPAGPSSSATNAAETVFYTLTLRLVDGEEALSDIAIFLQESDQEVSTDSDGVAVFTNLAQNQYTAAFAVNNESYEYVLSFAETETKIGSVSQTINLTDIEPLSETEEVLDTALAVTEESSSGLPYILGALLLVTFAAICFIMIRKRRTSKITKPAFRVATQQAPRPPESVHSPQTTTHAGISLKDLVIESMREEATRRNSQQR